MQPNIAKDLNRYRSDVQQFLEQKINRSYYYQKGAIVVNLKYDPWLKDVVSLLQHPKEYTEFLKSE